MDIIEIYEYFLLPLYLFAFYFLIVIKSRKYGHDPLRKYFITAFFLHMGGSFLYCMVIQYYYGYGDSFGFFNGGQFIRNVISSTGDPLGPFLMSSSDFERSYGAVNTGGFTLPTGIEIDSNLMVMKLSAALSYISFNSYLIISLFIGLFSFSGLWKLYKTMNEVSEKKSQHMLAILILYLPSICFWGSGLIKDSICIGAIGFIIYFMHKIFVKKKIKISDLILLILLSYLLFIIKSYLAIVLLISTVVAYLINVILKSRRNLIKLGIVSFIVLISTIAFITSFSSTLDSIIEDSKNNIEVFKGAYNSMTEEENGSGFSNIDTDFSISGILLRTPFAILTTLFRPFIWESGKPIIFLSALESLLTLSMTLFVLIKCRVWKFFYYIFSDPYLIFCFTFTIIVSIIIGLSTFNFGTLVRYRMPVLPFYFFLLIVIYIKNKEARLAANKPSS